MRSVATPRAPLARSTLSKMGVRIAVVITLATLFSYLHAYNLLVRDDGQLIAHPELKLEGAVHRARCASTPPRGLHSCALAGQELGGALTAHSDGPGKGATFTLELPYKPAQETS